MFHTIFRCLAVGALWVACASGQATSVPWASILAQPEGWYGSDEAIRIAETMLAYQRASGGWPKNIDMAQPLDATARARVTAARGERDSTIDNGATTTQIRFLARVFAATQQHRFQQAALAGIDFLLAAQYPNGGWPQFFPLRNDYSRYITFNDDAMIDVLTVLKNISEGRREFSFADMALRTRAADAVKRGIAVILVTQLRVDGQLTAWGAQHDERTLEPRPARSYEHASLSSRESVGIVRFLMSIPEPSDAVIEAIERAVAWLTRVKLEGLRVTDDGRLAKDASAPSLWARFYEIGTNRPIFSGRDGIVRYSLDEIEEERRRNYSWAGPYAANLLARDYPSWRKRMGRPDR